MGRFTHSPAGPQLKNMLERAIKWAKIQREAADSMTKTWVEYVPGWRRMLIAYKKDSSMPNPFRAPEPGKIFSLVHSPFTDQLPKDGALAALRIQLSKEDSAKAKGGGTSAYQMAPSAFIQRAMEIEADQ